MATPEEIQRKLNEPVGKKSNKLFGRNDSNIAPSSENNRFSLKQLTYKANGILFWKKVPRNCMMIVEDNIGKISAVKKKTGIRLSVPFLQKATIVELSAFSITYSINNHEGAVTKEGIDVHGTTRITYEIDTEHILKYYDQRFSDEQVSNESIAIIKEFISKYNWEELKDKKNRNIEEQQEVFAHAETMRKKYGIKIISIDTTGMQAPPEIEAREERRIAAENENLIKIRQAEADKKIRQIQNETRESEALTDAKIEGLKGTVRAQNTDKLINTLFAQGFDTKQALELLKRSITNQNCVLVESNGNSIDMQTIMMAMNELQKMNNNQQQYNQNNFQPTNEHSHRK